MKPLDPRLLRHARATRSMLVASAALGTAVGVAVVAQAWVIATAVSRVIQRGEASATYSLSIASLATPAPAPSGRDPGVADGPG